MNKKRPTDDTCGIELEWVRERETGPFKSWSHLLNHLDMIFAHEDESSRIAIVRTADEPPWRHFSRFDDESDLQRVKDHVRSHSSDCTEWSQIDVAWELDDSGEPIWGNPLPAGVGDAELLDFLRDSIEVWADMEGLEVSDFLETASCFILLPDWGGVVVDKVGVGSFGKNDCPFKINDRQVIGRKHGSSEPWKAFAFGICGSKSVKEALRELQDGKCPVCGEHIGDDSVVHHVDYDHECRHFEGEALAICNLHICDACRTEHEADFDDCLTRLKLVHPGCNLKIESITKRTSKKK